MSTKTLIDAALAFAKAFVAVAIIVAVGILTAPNLDGALALGIAGLAASVSAGVAALQTFVPAVSVRAYVAEPLGSALDAGIHAGLGLFVVSVTGWLAMPDFSSWRSFLVGLVAAVGAAFLRAVQGKLFGDQPQPAGLPRRADARAGTPAPRMLPLA